MRRVGTDLLTMLPDPRDSALYRGVWGVLAVGTGALAALAFVTVVQPLAGLLTVAACVLLFVPTGIAWAIALDHSWQSAIEPSLASAGLVVAFSGLSALIGPWSLLLLPVVVLLSPRMLSLGLRQLRGDDGPAAADTSSLRELARRRAWADLEPEDALVALTGPAVAELSVPGLCRLWRRTTDELDACRSAVRRLELVELRDRVLEEMSHRDSRGYLRWLQAGAAGTDPAAYLRRELRSPSGDSV